MRFNVKSTKRRGKLNQEAMQAGRARARMERPIEPRPPDRVGQLCEQWIRRRLFNGEIVEEYVCECYGTKRIDSFRVVANGEQQPKRIGASRVAVLLREAFPRVLSPRNL